MNNKLCVDALPRTLLACVTCHYRRPCYTQTATEGQRDQHYKQEKGCHIHIKTDIKNVHHLSLLVQLRSSDSKQPVFKYFFLIIH